MVSHRCLCAGRGCRGWSPGWPALQSSQSRLCPHRRVRRWRARSWQQPRQLPAFRCPAPRLQPSLPRSSSSRRRWRSLGCETHNVTACTPSAGQQSSCSQHLSSGCQASLCVGSVCSVFAGLAELCCQGTCSRCLCALGQPEVKPTSACPCAIAMPQVSVSPSRTEAVVGSLTAQQIWCAI